jgi:hypothetical protein
MCRIQRTVVHPDQVDGGYNAVKKGKVGKRVGRRVAGKATGKAMRKLFK